MESWTVRGECGWPHWGITAFGETLYFLLTLLSIYPRRNVSEIKGIVTHGMQSRTHTLSELKTNKGAITHGMQPRTHILSELN